MDSHKSEMVGFGKSYFFGNNPAEGVKLDLYYTDQFIHQPILREQIRMADIEEIAAMKMEVIAHGGRQKDFWDLHELTNHLTIDSLLNLHAERYPYGNDRSHLLKKLLTLQRQTMILNLYV